MIRTVKAIIRYLLEQLISVIDPRTFHVFNANNLLILTYHRVLPSSHPDLKYEQPGMYVTPQTFKLHMDEIQKRFELFHLDDWIRAVKNNEPLPKYACAITFDDGWLDNYEYAYPILKELEVPATIFVVSSFLGTSYSFWPNRLNRLLGKLTAGQLNDFIESVEGSWLKDIIHEDSLITAKIDADKINQVIESCKIYTENELNSFLDNMESRLDGHLISDGVDLMSQHHLQEMIESGFVKVGSHTCHHKRLLDGLDKNEIDDEIINSQKDLQGQLNADISLFCYPNGDYSQYSLDVVNENYSAACSTMNGWNTPSANMLLLKRIGVHEDISFDKHKFLARLSGLF